MTLAPDRPRAAPLVDAAERSLRDWLAPGRRRTGDRLPPEHELAAMLGISRGTLRAALKRLEASGEIVRRRGSGTFVGRTSAGAELNAGLEVLESYASLARRQGLRLSVSELVLGTAPAGDEAEAALGLAPGTSTLVVTRTLLADGVRAAWMRDVVAPSVALPRTAALERRLRAGHMLLDVLAEHGLAVASARTQVRPVLVQPGDPLADALGLDAPVAALDLTETMHARDGTPLQHSRNVFGPGRMSVHINRALRHDEPLRSILPPLARRS